MLVNQFCRSVMLDRHNQAMHTGILRPESSSSYILLTMTFRSRDSAY
jgi:hypothetical protein